MQIGELAALAGLSREALRFYEQQGLIRARRLPNGYRDFPPEAVMLVQYIRTAQQLGFTLAEIGDRLPALWDAPDPTPALAAVLAHKLDEIDARIAALTQLRGLLAERIALSCPLARVEEAPARHADSEPNTPSTPIRRSPVASKKRAPKATAR